LISRIAAGAAPAVSLVAAWIVTTTVGPTSEVGPDVALYHAYAQDIGRGLVPYRDFLFEYPPLALAPIVVADAFGSSDRAFQTAFETFMLGSLLVIQWQARGLAGDRGRAVAWSLVLLPPAAGGIVAQRLDVFATAFVVAGLAVLAVRHEEPSPRRAAFALALFALGTATKLFPALAAAVALAWLWGQGRRRAAGAGAATFAAVALVVCAPFVLAAPDGFLDQFAFHSQRPVQVESTPAAVLRLVADPLVTGGEERPNEFRSDGLEGGPTAAVGGVFAALQLAAILLAILSASAAGRASARSAGLLLPAAAALLAFVALGKVFSPQFMLWLAPLAPLLWLERARTAAVLILVALVLTQFEFPHHYSSVVAGDPFGVALLVARNGALLLALALLLAQAARMAPDREERSTDTATVPRDRSRRAVREADTRGRAHT
jgi:hypothetical protein